VEVDATPYVVDQRFLWAGAASAEAVVAHDPQAVLERLRRAGEVRRTALEVPAVADATSSAIPLDTATARGELEARALGQE
jgi:hypothetical protein